MKKTLLLLLVILAAAASAQESLILPTRSEPCGDLTIQLVTPASPATPGAGLSIERAVGIVPGRRFPLPLFVVGNDLFFHFTVPDQGTSIVGIDLQPRVLEVAPIDVPQYLQHIGASEEVVARWRSAGGGAWRERHTGHAKMYFRCGHADHRYQMSVDMGMELVPQGTDPTALHGGDTLRVALIEPNKPLLAVPIHLTRDDGTRVATFLPGRDRVTSISLPHQPGRYALTATTIAPADGRDVDWITESTSLAFNVN